MQTSGEEKMSPDCNLSLKTQLGRDFFANLKISEDSEDGDVKEEEKVVLENHGDGEEDDEEEEEEEFSFMCGGANSSPIAAEDAFADGQIKPVFPLFNSELLFPVDLPMRPPVKKVFVEAREENSHATSSTPENDGAAGPYCDWSTGKAVEASPEVCKKSNSTGFSKIWRFKDLLGRSNSDGRDAFVFLDNANPPPRTAAPAEKVKAKKGGKGKKTAAMSAHEVYLKSKAKGDDRRRSYLPYRPELMGFFTNINGGLTKNVHPF